MNRHGIWIETKHGTSSRIDPDSDDPTGNQISANHRCSAGGGYFAFHSDGLGDVAQLAHRNIETFSSAPNKLRRCNSALASRELNGRAGRFALHIKFIVHAASNRGAGNKQKRQKQRANSCHEAETLLSHLPIAIRNPLACLLNCD